MSRFAIAVLAAWSLAACSATPSRNELLIVVEPPAFEELPIPGGSPALENWLLFADRVNRMESLELVIERDATVARYREQATDDETRLRLAYLLSRPRMPVQELTESRTLLAGIGADSVYASLADLVARELMLITELSASQQQTDELQGRVRDLETQVANLQTQLDALKAIETDLTEDQKNTEELPQ